MTDEELKLKCKERVKIFQQAIESCHSSSPIDCIEWFADRIAELEKENGRLEGKIADWESEYIELENLKNNEIAELKEKLKPENCLKSLAKSGFVKFTTDTTDQLAQATQTIKEIEKIFYNGESKEKRLIKIGEVLEQAEQFLKEIEK